MTDAWSSLIQAIIWPGLIITLIIIYRDKFAGLLKVVQRRIERGAAFKLGPLDIGKIPPAILSGKRDQATAEGPGGAKAPGNVMDIMLNRKYPEGIDEEIYLVHTATIARSPGPVARTRFSVRIWVEAYSERQVDEIVRVTYRLHDTFPNPVISTQEREHEFELWLNVWGEFTIMAYVERRDKPPLWLSRYLELPGRPEG